MQISIVGQIVNASTDGMVDLQTLLDAGNVWRLQNKMRPYQMSLFYNSKYLKEYVRAASEVWGLPEGSFYKVGERGGRATAKGHVSVAVLLAEQISPMFHAEVHKVFIEGKILEHRISGGDEYKRLNSLISIHIPSPSGNDIGRIVNTAKMIRDKCEVKPCDGDIETWNQDSANYVAQQKRFEVISNLCLFLENGLVRDFEHLKTLI